MRSRPLRWCLVPGHYSKPGPANARTREHPCSLRFHWGMYASTEASLRGHVRCAHIKSCTLNRLPGISSLPRRSFYCQGASSRPVQARPGSGLPGLRLGEKLRRKLLGLHSLPATITRRSRKLRQEPAAPCLSFRFLPPCAGSCSSGYANERRQIATCLSRCPNARRKTVQMKASASLQQLFLR